MRATDLCGAFYVVMEKQQSNVIASIPEVKTTQNLSGQDKIVWELVLAQIIIDEKYRRTYL